ncbi:MAG: HEPN domain-containing protein [Myxococcota bacterium]
MTSHLRARDLLWFTGDELGEMRRALASGNWNLAVRRGQEVLETSVKAVLLHLGGDYPKSHDPVPALRLVLGKRGHSVDEQRLERIGAASRDLAKKRGPAGYVEILCTEAEGRAAAEAAEDTFLLATEICGPPPPGPFRPGAA